MLYKDRMFLDDDLGSSSRMFFPLPITAVFSLFCAEEGRHRPEGCRMGVGLGRSWRSWVWRFFEKSH